MQLTDEADCTEVPDGLPSREQLLAKLQVFIDEMLTTEQLVIPTLRWDPMSANKKEVLAVARVGLLISAYEPQYYWFEPLPF